MLNPNQITDLITLLRLLASQQRGSTTPSQGPGEFRGLSGLSSGGYSSDGMAGLSSGGLGGLGGMSGPGGGLGGGISQDHDPLGSRAVDFLSAVVSTARSIPGPQQLPAAIVGAILAALDKTGVVSAGRTNKYVEALSTLPLPYTRPVRDWMRFLRVDPQVLPQPAIDPLAVSMSGFTEPGDPLQDPPEDYRDFEVGVTGPSYTSNPEAYAAAAYGPSAYGSTLGSPLGSISFTDLDAFAADYSGMSFSDPSFDFSTDFAGVAGTSDPAADYDMDSYSSGAATAADTADAAAGDTSDTDDGGANDDAGSEGSDY